LRTHQCGPEVAIIDAHQQLPGFDRLVVVDEYVGDLAGDTRRHEGEIRLDIGIVGGFGIGAARQA
jgi:hypothetical protein